MEKKIVGYFSRSLNYIKDKTVAAFNLSPHWKEPKELYDFKSVDVIKDWIVGSDADFGGYSKAFLGLKDNKNAIFWGSLSCQIPENSPVEQSGYAAIRSKELPLVLLHRPRHDASLYRYLCIRAKGDARQWFVNIRTESIYPSFVWQHRLYFSTPGKWETIMIPFRDFVLTSHGFVQPNQFQMDRSKIKTIGFSIVRQPGDFSLEIEKLYFYNSENTIGDYDIQ